MPRHVEAGIRWHIRRGAINTAFVAVTVHLACPVAGGACLHLRETVLLLPSRGAAAEASRRISQ